MAAANDANHLMAPMMTGALMEGTALALALAARQSSIDWARVGGPNNNQREPSI